MVIRLFLAAGLMLSLNAPAFAKQQGTCCFSRTWFAQNESPKGGCIKAISCADIKKGGLYVRCYFQTPNDVHLKIKGKKVRPSWMGCNHYYRFPELKTKSGQVVKQEIGLCSRYPTKAPRRIISAGEAIYGVGKYSKRKLDSDALGFCNGKFDRWLKIRKETASYVDYHFNISAEANANSGPVQKKWDSFKKAWVYQNAAMHHTKVLAKGKIKITR